MRNRQFKRLATLPTTDRMLLLLTGLEAIAENVANLAEEVKRAEDAGAVRAAQIVGNLCTEEAGKFLILVDAWRAPGADEATLQHHYGLVADHLAKLIYAQMVDYSIASRAELHRAIDHHRRRYHLDGPNDFDWIFANRLKSEREGVLYVDLVESEGKLEWASPLADEMPVGLMSSRPPKLVTALMASGLITEAGKQNLNQAWADFDPQGDSRYADWQRRTIAALSGLHGDVPLDAAQTVVELWPMPMVGFELGEDSTKVEELMLQREAKFQAMHADTSGFERDAPGFKPDR